MSSFPCYPNLCLPFPVRLKSFLALRELKKTRKEERVNKIWSEKRVRSKCYKRFPAKFNQQWREMSRSKLHCQHFASPDLWLRPVFAVRKGPYLSSLPPPPLPTSTCRLFHDRWHPSFREQWYTLSFIWDHWLCITPHKTSRNMVCVMIQTFIPFVMSTHVLTVTQMSDFKDVQYHQVVDEMCYSMNILLTSLSFADAILWNQQANFVGSYHGSRYPRRGKWLSFDDSSCRVDGGTNRENRPVQSPLVW